MRWALNGSVAMNGREREGWDGVERLQEGSKGLSYTDEWALAGNHRVASLSNESEDATRKESTCKLIFTKRKGYDMLQKSVCMSCKPTEKSTDVRYTSLGSSGPWDA